MLGKSYSSGQRVKNLTATDGGVIIMTAKWKLQSPYTMTYQTNFVNKEIDVSGGYSKITLTIAKGGHNGYKSTIEIKNGTKSLAYSYSGSGGGNTISATIPSGVKKLKITADHVDQYGTKCSTKHKVTVTLTK